MKKNGMYVITINRMFGSGGHQIGVELAKRLGIRCIDKYVLEETSKQLNIDSAKLKELEEKTPHWWEDFIKFYSNQGDMAEGHCLNRGITTRQIFTVQTKVMKDIAACKSCVIIGRCAFNVFKDSPNAIKVFIYADEEFRIKRIMEAYNINEAEAKRMIKENDDRRETYTKTYTGKNREDATNYDICINSSRVGLDKCVDFIIEMCNLVNSDKE